MKRLFVCIFLMLSSCYTIERDCIPFHQGTFEFSQIINGSMKTSTFTRDSLYEIERFEGKIDTASIRWVNDCECILTKINPTSNQDKRPIQIKIISTQDNSYTFEYSLVGDSKNTQRGTIQKIQ
ncbi:MAG: DNA topoisomerase IV [Flavobacteriaceae bacterium]|nr:DNA topoisomerase IV [Flavobacteriaceae bacterium]